MRARVILAYSFGISPAEVRTLTGMEVAQMWRLLKELRTDG